MIHHPLWKAVKLPDEAWRPPKALPHSARAAEQDLAAGGRDARIIRLPGGRRAHASIALRALTKSRRIYAYLRYSINGKTQERYVGEVDQHTRAENLAQAWRIVQERALLDPREPDTDTRGI